MIVPKRRTLVRPRTSHPVQNVYLTPASGTGFDLSPLSSSLTRTLPVKTSLDSLGNERTLMPMDALVML